VAYTEALHKRGTGAQGGQFITKGAGGQTTTTSHIGYDGKGRGTGYGTGGDPNVSALQKQLNRLGIVDSQGNQLKVDGKFGPKTTAAVRRLQQRLGLTVDGKVTPALLAKLKTMKPSMHDQHAMHVRHQVAQHKKHTAHAAHVQHEKHAAKAKKPAPARRAPVRKTAATHRKARTGMGSNPKVNAQHPSQSARDSAARKNSMSRSVSYSTGMTDIERHLPGRHNQQSHANRVGNIKAPSLGLGKDLEEKAAAKAREFSTEDIQKILVPGEVKHAFAGGASRKTEDHIKLLKDAGASHEQAHAIAKDIGLDPERGYETKDVAPHLFYKVEGEKKAKAEAAHAAALAKATPSAYEQLLGENGKTALVKSKRLQEVFQAARSADWVVSGANGHGGYTFSSPDGSKKLQILTINGVKIYDERHNPISGTKALGLIG
jgi:peptidoglycan hydrolase-like protein with peptidoglycan-binding domain